MATPVPARSKDPAYMLNGGIVRVLVHGARGLAALNGGSRPSSNARVVLKLGSGKGSEFTTKLISDTLTPSHCASVANALQAS